MGFTPPHPTLIPFGFCWGLPTGLVKTSRSWGLDSTKPSWTSNDGFLWLPWVMTCWCTFWECWDLLLPQQVMISHWESTVCQGITSISRFHDILQPYGVYALSILEEFHGRNSRDVERQQQWHRSWHTLDLQHLQTAPGEQSPGHTPGPRQPTARLKSKGRLGFPSYFLCSFWCLMRASCWNLLHYYQGYGLSEKNHAPLGMSMYKTL